MLYFSYSPESLDWVTVEYSSPSARIYLYGLNGRSIASLSSTGGRATLPTTDLPPGVYLIRLEGDWGTAQTRLVVK